MSSFVDNLVSFICFVLFFFFLIMPPDFQGKKAIHGDWYPWWNSSFIYFYFFPPFRILAIVYLIGTHSVNLTSNSVLRIHSGLSLQDPKISLINSWVCVFIYGHYFRIILQSRLQKKKQHLIFTFMNFNSTSNVMTQLRCVFCFALKLWGSYR